MKAAAPLLFVLLAAAPLRARDEAPAAEPAAPAAAAISTGTVSALRPLSLADAYELSLARSEALAVARASQTFILAQIDELWGAVKPKVSLSPADVLQDDIGGSGAVQTFNPRNRFTLPIAVHQPLFTGFRELLALRADQSLGRAAGLQIEQAKHRLYRDVAQAYLGVLGWQEQLDIQGEIARATQSRIKELRAFERLGRSRKSEVLAAQAQLAQVEAQVEALRGSERVAQRALGFLTGLEEDVRPLAPPAPPARELAGFLQRSHSRPDVEAAREALRAQDLEVEIARRGSWPVLAADGNYYLDRPAYVRPIRWDLTFSMQLPLYTGGVVDAQIREGLARRRAEEESVSLAERGAELQVKSAFRRLEADRASAAALEKAEALADANAKAQSEDYRLGLVTNIDVLNAITSLEQTRLSLAQARLDAALADIELEVAAGGPR